MDRIRMAEKLTKVGLELLETAAELKSQGGVVQTTVRTLVRRPQPTAGLRAIVRDVLAESAVPMASGEVTAVLKEKGVKVGGRTSLSMRVSNELSKMVRQREVLRTTDGYMAVPQRGNGRDVGRGAEVGH